MMAFWLEQGEHLLPVRCPDSRNSLCRITHNRPFLRYWTGPALKRRLGAETRDRHRVGDNIYGSDQFVF